MRFRNVSSSRPLDVPENPAAGLAGSKVDFTSHSRTDYLTSKNELCGALAQGKLSRLLEFYKILYSS